MEKIYSSFYASCTTMTRLQDKMELVGVASFSRIFFSKYIFIINKECILFASILSMTGVFLYKLFHYPWEHDSFHRYIFC